MSCYVSKTKSKLIKSQWLPMYTFLLYFESEIPMYDSHTNRSAHLQAQHHRTFPKCSFLPMNFTQQSSHHVLTGCCLHHCLLYVLMGKALQTSRLLFFLFLLPVIIILLSLPPKCRKPRPPIAIFGLRLPQEMIFFSFNNFSSPSYSL